MAIPLSDAAIPFLTTEQMVEVDRAMMEDYRISLIQMMENAGRNLAHVARSRFLGLDPSSVRVVVLAGSGGNGGGALVCARRLSIYGAKVSVFTTKPMNAFKAVPALQLDILGRMEIGIYQVDKLKTMAGSADLIIDGLIGYNLNGAPRGSAAAMIRWANGQKTPVLALDTPSGLDMTSGTVFDPAIRAAATMTLALPKKGLRAVGANDFVGELYLADISVPPQLYRKFGLEIGPIFAQSDIIQINKLQDFT